MFKNIRLSYLDDLENDPEVAEIIGSYSSADEFIHAKTRIGDNKWTDEFLEKTGFNSDLRNNHINLGRISEYWWEVCGDEIYCNSGVCEKRPLNPSPGWDVYYHPRLKVSVVIDNPSLSEESINKILTLAAKNPAAYDRIEISELENV